MLSVNIIRDISSPGHSFNIALKPFRDYSYWSDSVFATLDDDSNNYIATGDWIEIFATSPSISPEFVTYPQEIEIELKRSGEKYTVYNCYRRFIGIIERAERDDKVVGGALTMGFNISGKSWAKTLLESPVVLVPWFKGALPLARRMGDLKIEASPDENIKKLIQLYYGANQHQVPKSLRNKLSIVPSNQRAEASLISNLPGLSTSFDTIYSYVDFKFSPCDGKVMDTQMLTTVSGLWQLIQQYHEPLMNEIWADIDDLGNPVLVLREYPYSNSITIPTELRSNKRTYFNELDTVEVGYSEWDAIKVGRSDHERTNWWVATSNSHPQGSVMTQKGTLYADSLQYDIDSIKRYGLKQMEVGTLYSFYPDRKNRDNWKEIVTRFSKLMRHWHENDHHFLNGSARIYDRFDIKIGKRLVVSDIKANVGGKSFSEEYYVVGVNESWVVNGPATFDVKVCRGQRVIESPFGNVFNSLFGA